MFFPHPPFPHWLFLQNGTFIEEIINWAKNIFDEIASSVLKAWVYVRKISGAIKQFMRYLNDGTIFERTKITSVSLEHLCEMKEKGDISQREYEVLISEQATKIAEINRDGEIVRYISCE